MKVFSCESPRSPLVIRIASHIGPTAAIAAVVAGACTAPNDLVAADLGPIEQLVDESMREQWPGVDEPDGSRVIPLVNGFAAGKPVSYWFAGPAPRTTADMYWFCRDGDVQCPLDEHGAVDRSRTVGGPVFARMPGEASYSPFWWVRVVRVPDDYEADSIKSVFGIQQAIRNGRASLPWYHHNFAGWIGPEKAIEHTLMVLDGTRLEGNGDVLASGQPSQSVPLHEGWYQRYRVKFYDFTETEGVLPPATPAQAWTPPAVPTAAMFVLFRDCAADRSTSAVCATDASMNGAVTERALALDLTGDGDHADTNNVLSATPRTDPLYPNVAAYSPLWAVQEIPVVGARDAEVALIDTTGNQALSDVRDAAAIADLVAAGLLGTAEPMSESRVGTAITGNGGAVFHDCPARVEARSGAR